MRKVAPVVKIDFTAFRCISICLKEGLQGKSHLFYLIRAGKLLRIMYSRKIYFARTRFKKTVAWDSLPQKNEMGCGSVQNRDILAGSRY
jgi:hypothetical protein